MSLYRNTDEQLIFGVCAGLAESLRVPSLALRIAFVLLGLTWGLGVVAYVLLALLMDDEGAIADVDDERELEERMAGNGREALSRVRTLGREIGGNAKAAFREGDPDNPRQKKMGVTLLVVGAIIILWALGLLAWVSLPVLIGGVVLAYGAWLLFGNRNDPPRP